MFLVAQPIFQQLTYGLTSVFIGKRKPSSMGGISLSENAEATLSRPMELVNQCPSIASLECIISYPGICIDKQATIFLEWDISLVFVV